MPDTARRGITVVIPAFDEAKAIGETLVAVRDTLQLMSRSSEIIVVDDGSQDETGALAEATGATVIRHPTNSGYGRALLTGIDAARYETIAIVDADGTYAAEGLPRLVAEYDRGFHMVVGARQGQYYDGSLGKRLLRIMFRLLTEFACGRPIPDINSGFRVFDRSPVLASRASLSPGFSFTTTITLLFMLNNLFVSYVPITYARRVGQSKVRLFRDSLRSMQIVVTAIAQFNPLKLFLLLVMACWGGSIVLLVLEYGVGVPFAGGLLIAWNISLVIMGISVLALMQLRSAR